MTGKLAWFGAIISGCAMAAACGSSSSNGGSPADAGPGDATAPSDDSGSPGDDGSSTPPVTCGSTTCQAPSGGLLPLAACCLPDNSCGGTFSAGGLGGLAGMFGGATTFDAGAFDASAFGDAGLGDGGLPCLNLSAGTSDPAWRPSLSSG